MDKIPNVPDELQEDLKKRMEGQFEPLFKKNGEPAITKNFGREDVQIVICKKTGKIHGGEQGFYTLGHYDYLTDEENSVIRNKHSENAERVRFEKAEKIKFSDWHGEQFFDGDNFQIDLDMFFDEMFTLHGLQYEKWQTYVWATEEKPIINEKDAYDVYQCDLDDLDPEYDWHVNGAKDLQEALDEFVECNKENKVFYPDFSTALLIESEIQEFKKNYED